ncbi:MAG: RNase H family protein, partial [Cetobacterium sp.]
LASVTKRLLQIKAVAKEQPIMIYSMAGELARLKKNLVMNQQRIHCHRFDQWNLILSDTQLEWRMTKLKRKDKMTKYQDKHQHLPKYFTDGSEKAGKTKWGYLVRKDGQLITSKSQEIEGTAQLAEVVAVEKALEKAVELGHKEIVLTCDSEYVSDGINRELEVWKANGFHTARNKPMAHREQWMKIADLLTQVVTHCYHQISHSRQTTESAVGNRQVDKMIGRVKQQDLTELFEKMHDQLNHPSYNMIQFELRLRNLSIPNWRARYREVKKECNICRKFMTAKGAHDSELPKEFRNQEVSIDFAGPMRKTKLGNCYFLLAIDNHTKMKMIWPMRSAKVENVVECLKQWIRWQGKMQSLRADGAHNLSGNLTQKFCKENGIILTKSVRYHPETNGIAERGIREVKEYFCKNEELGEWDTIIDRCLLDLNRCNKVEPKEREVKTNPKFRPGDQVIITRRKKIGRFKEGPGTVDTVKAITGSNTVELEANGIYHNRDLIKK